MFPINSFKITFRRIKHQLKVAKRIYSDRKFYDTYIISKAEGKKTPSRTEIISFLLNKINGENYLEIGVRNPDDNFNKINSKNKYSVDPGKEFKKNPVDFKMTSDEFFKSLRGEILNISNNIKFDLIFIDGLHLANQVEEDILNSLDFISDNGFIVLHDCNPPTEFHTRETYNFHNTPAKGFWNGTTWKAFYRFRYYPNLYSICFDTDWGVGVISKTKYTDFNTLDLPIKNPYFEFNNHLKNRNSNMNLQNFDTWAKKVK